MNQELSWHVQYSLIMRYMKCYQRRPSKHRPEDRRMHNWIKYNKRLLAKGELTEDRAERFQQLLDTAEKYRRRNQYT